MKIQSSNHDTAHYVFTLNLPFFDVCRDHSNKVKSLEKDINEIGVNRFTDSVLGTLNYTDWEMKKSAIIAVTFASTTLEYFIHNYACDNLGAKYVEDHLSRLSTISKWIVIPKMVTNSEFKKTSSAFNAFNELTKVRNKIVHFKPERMSVENSNSKRNENERNALFKKLEMKHNQLDILNKQLLSCAKNAPYIVVNMMEELMKIDKDENLKEEVESIIK